MSTIVEQAEEFRRFVAEQNANGGSELSLAELFERWQLVSLSEEELQESLAAFDQGVADAEAGRTVDAKESVERLRRRLQQMQ